MTLTIKNGKVLLNGKLEKKNIIIENGKITTPIKGATFIGSGHEVLKKISMVGNDLKLDSGIGNCGKAGQTVPVGVGQPTLKIESMTLGGVSSE